MATNMANSINEKAPDVQGRIDQASRLQSQNIQGASRQYNPQWNIQNPDQLRYQGSRDLNNPWGAVDMSGLRNEINKFGDEVNAFGSSAGRQAMLQRQNQNRGYTSGMAQWDAALMGDPTQTRAAQALKDRYRGFVDSFNTATGQARERLDTAIKTGDQQADAMKVQMDQNAADAERKAKEIAKAKAEDQIRQATPAYNKSLNDFASWLGNNPKADEARLDHMDKMGMDTSLARYGFGPRPKRKPIEIWNRLLAPALASK
jgi:hypothetical protein